jgi:hypothetical protein
MGRISATKPLVDVMLVGTDGWCDSTIHDQVVAARAAPSFQEGERLWPPPRQRQALDPGPAAHAAHAVAATHPCRHALRSAAIAAARR